MTTPITTSPTPTRLLSSMWFPVVLLGLIAGGCDKSADNTVAVGTIERDRLELIAETSEPIVELSVREGQMVAAGDPIVTFDLRRLTAEVHRAEAARDLAMARLAELERGPRSEQITEARAAVAGFKGILERDRRELTRARTLRKQGVLSPSESDAAQAALDNSLAQYERAVAELDALETGSTAEELDQARAAVAEAQGGLDGIRVTLARLTVRAPVAGRIDALPFELGEQPPIGAVVAVMLADSRPYARVYIPEPIRARVRAGTAAKVRVDGVEKAFPARVRTVAGDPMFTPFFALTESDRGRLAYLAELDLEGDLADDLPSGIPAEAHFHFDAVSTDRDE